MEGMAARARARHRSVRSFLTSVVRSTDVSIRRTLCRAQPMHLQTRMDAEKLIVTELHDDALDAEDEAVAQAKAFREAIRSVWTRDFALRAQVLDHEMRASCAGADLRRWASTYAREEGETTRAEGLTPTSKSIARGAEAAARSLLARAVDVS
jgi:hypothetical protein